jgi:hypothetical protein
LSQWLLPGAARKTSPFAFLDRHRLPIGGREMNTHSKTAGPGSAPVNSSRRFVAQAEAAIADLEERFSSGIGPAERTLAERIRAAAARLLECAAQVAADGLMVLGSTGQQRPHRC